MEFALVSGVFFLVLFGIIQYGLYFNDSLNTRQGVREAARHAVVENFSFQTGCSTGANSAQLRCSTGKEVGAITGSPLVKVQATQWQKGKPLVVCPSTAPQDARAALSSTGSPAAMELDARVPSRPEHSRDEGPSLGKLRLAVYGLGGIAALLAMLSAALLVSRREPASKSLDPVPSSAPASALSSPPSCRVQAHPSRIGATLDRSVTLHPGELKTVRYRVVNTLDRPVTAHAVMNTAPAVANRYIEKQACFCFSD